MDRKAGRFGDIDSLDELAGLLTVGGEEEVSSRQTEEARDKGA